MSQQSVLLGAVVANLQMPCVYLLYRGDDCLYVGMGSNGIGRPLDRYHSMNEYMKDTDELLIIWPDNSDDIGELEKNLILLLKPKKNKHLLQSNWSLEHLSKTIKEVQA